MFKNLGVKDLLQLILIVIFFMVIITLYVDNQLRNKLWQKTYPVRAYISLSNVSCSDNSPEWMTKILTYKVMEHNALSNQLVYIDEKGKLFHCENGYVSKYPLLSPQVTNETRFRYASITKLWTSDTILSMIKAGKLNFDTRLSSVLTEINNPKDERINEITIGQLLSHRGGFDRYSISGNDMFGIGKNICPNHIVKMNEIKLNFTPGEKMSYSNLGYCLLGEVISRVDNKSYQESIKDRYDFDRNNLKFVKNMKMSDEVFYNHVETGLMGTTDIFTEFNYNDLAAVAGLSGDASTLAVQIKQMLDKPEPNILSINQLDNCDLSLLEDCYGYAMYPYQKHETDQKVYLRSGSLRGLSTLVSVTDDGRVIALLSNGISQKDRIAIQYKIYDVFNHNH